MFGPYYRVGDPPDVVRKIIKSGELRGTPPRNIFQSDFPKVKAYSGHLPEGERGFEFETDVPPATGNFVNNQAYGVGDGYGLRCDQKNSFIPVRKDLASVSVNRYGS
jgi:hypothetical protein